MGKVQINPSVLRKAASNLNDAIQSLNTAYSGLQRVEGDVPVYWKSEYTDVYLDEMREVRRKVDKTKREIENIQRGLNETARRVEKAEEEIMNAFTKPGSSSGTVPGTLPAGIGAAIDAIKSKHK